MLGPGDEEIDQAALQYIAENEQHRRDRNEQDQRIEMEAGAEHDRQEHGDCHHLAMREIHDAHDAEDDRQPERHQAVDQAGQHPADGDVQINVKRHRSPTNTTAL